MVRCVGRDTARPIGRARAFGGALPCSTRLMCGKKWISAIIPTK